MSTSIPYGVSGGEADLFKQLTRVERKNTSNPQGHIEESIHNGFEPMLCEVMSAGSLTKERQIGQIYRAQFVAQAVQKSIQKMRYEQTTLPKIMGAYANVLTKISQSGEGPGNLVQKIKTAFTIAQTTSKHEESLHARGKVR